MSRALKLSDLPKDAQDFLRQRRALVAPQKESKPKKRRSKDQAVRKAKADAIRAAFKLRCKDNGLPIPATEYIFDQSSAKRRFAFDYAWIDEKIALEVDGGIWVGGAHGRGSGILRDQEKRNLATVQGWAVYHCVPKTLMADETVALLQNAMQARAA